MNIYDLDCCPECNVSWDGGDIYETLKSTPLYKDYSSDELLEAAMSYGWNENDKKRFKAGNFIGIEIMMVYDGVRLWHCQDCGCVWDAFTDELLIDTSGKYTIAVQQLDPDMINFLDSLHK